MLAVTRFAANLDHPTDDMARTAAAEVVQEVVRLAGVRRLRVIGQPGEVVTYSPHAHQLTPGGNPAVKVRIVRPLVERTNAMGHSEILVRAVVEPADEV
jgi:hypothetical protein